MPIVHVKILRVNHAGVGCRECGPVVSPSPHVYGNLRLVIRAKRQVQERRLDRLD
jgi:hypothetical protein